MCGRFTSLTPPDELAALFDAEATPEVRAENFSMNFNVAPSTAILAVALSSSGERRLGRLKWGLVPSWAKVPPGTGHINARSETIAEKPSFRDSFRKRRCIVPMSGYYEWRTVPDARRRDGSAAKRAVYVTRTDGRPLAVAGLWSTWIPPDSPQDRPADPLRTCCIVTCAANARLSAVHDRMPVVIEAEHWGTWLGEDHSEDLSDVSDLLLLDDDSTRLDYVDVGPLVNSVRNNGPDLIAPSA